MTKHPQSDGLRAIADFLDNCAEESLPQFAISFVHSAAEWAMDDEAQRKLIAAIRKRAPLMVPTITQYTNELSGMFGGGQEVASRGSNSR